MLRCWRFVNFVIRLQYNLRFVLLVRVCVDSLGLIWHSHFGKCGGGPTVFVVKVQICFFYCLCAVGLADDGLVRCSRLVWGCRVQVIDAGSLLNFGVHWKLTKHLARLGLPRCGWKYLGHGRCLIWNSGYYHSAAIAWSSPSSYRLSLRRLFLISLHTDPRLVR
jgi:hypothetical protein